MEKHEPEPHILFLSGVTMADYRSPEDDLDEKLLSVVQPERGDPMPFDEIPQLFTGLDRWPRTTNLKCWVCDFQFGDRPVFVPKFIRQRGHEAGVVVGVLGNMCTFNCAELYIEDTFADHETAWGYQRNLIVLYELFTGKPATRIKPAPSKTKMRQYGGTWTEEEFWKALRALDPEHGLTDHTLGSIRPERERDYDTAPPPRLSQDDRLRGSLWRICAGVVPPPPPPPEDLVAEDLVAEDLVAEDLVAPSSSAAPGTTSHAPVARGAQQPQEDFEQHSSQHQDAAAEDGAPAATGVASSAETSRRMLASPATTPHTADDRADGATDGAATGVGTASVAAAASEAENDMDAFLGQLLDDM